MLYHLYGFDGKSMILYLWLDVFGGGMGWWLFSTKRDAYGDIYSLPFSLYGICIASHSLHWHMELCCKPMVPTVSVQHRLLGIMMQFHTLLDMKAGDMELHCICIMILGIWGVCLGVLVVNLILWRNCIIGFDILLFLFGLPVMEILNRCLMNF